MEMALMSMSVSERPLPFFSRDLMREIIRLYVSDGLNSGFVVRDDWAKSWGKAERQDTAMAAQWLVLLLSF